MEPPDPDCRLHPSAEVSPSRLVSEGELRRMFADPGGAYVDTIALADDAHLVLPAGRPNGKGNHSCDPNLWWEGPYDLVARRDIAAGEELTNDYATSAGLEDFRM